MADKTPPANNPEDNPQGKDEGKGKGNVSEISPEEFSKLKTENENLRGTVSTLTKKIDTFTDTLKKGFGGEEENKAKDPLQLIEGLSQELQSVKQENARAKAKNFLYQVVDDLTDEDGNPVSEDVKKYLKTDIEVSEPDEEKIKETVSRKAQSLLSILKETGKTFTDKRPEAKGKVGFIDRPQNANEILENLKKK